jgi:hypothetical protein
MAFQPDITVRKSDGTPIAFIEVKNREGLDASIAARLRRNMVVHGLQYAAPYFLLLSQDWGYGWTRASQSKPEAPPEFTFAMRPVLDRYLHGPHWTERLRGTELELVVWQWMQDLANETPESLGESADRLGSAGFLEAIRGADVLLQAA